MEFLSTVVSALACILLGLVIDYADGLAAKREERKMEAKRWFT